MRNGRWRACVQCVYLRIHKRTHTYTQIQESHVELAESFTEYDAKWYFGPEDSPGWAAAVETGMRCECACVRACVRALSLSVCVSECTSIQIFLSVPVCGACVWKVSCVRVCAARAHGGNGYVLCACVCSCAGVFVLRYVLCVWVVGVCVRWCVGVVVCVRVSCTGS